MPSLEGDTVVDAADAPMTAAASADSAVDSPAAGPQAATNPALPALLQALLAGQGGLPAGAGLDRSALLTSLLGGTSAGGDNPTLAALLQWMQASATPAAAAPAPETVDADEADAAAAPERADGMPALADVRALVAHARAMEREIDMLRQRNDSLAGALGACYLCFGEQDDCPVCRGRGVPGRRAPQPDLFNCWVQPVLDRWLPEDHEPPRPARRARTPMTAPTGVAAPRHPAPRAGTGLAGDLSAAWHTRGGPGRGYTQ